MTTKDVFQLHGKVALISGGARGLGLAIAQTMVDAGASVMLGDILVKEGEASATKLGPRAAFVKLDVTNESDWEAACAATVKKFIKIADLQDPAKVQKIIQKFAAKYDIANSQSQGDPILALFDTSSASSGVSISQDTYASILNLKLGGI